VANNADPNTATGAGALVSNFTGTANTANGAFALYYNNADFNTGIGEEALANNTTGSQNTALGQGAGFNQTTGSSNVYIGAGMLGVAGESNACYIKSIFGQTSAIGIPILINSSNKLGTMTSSKRFKKDIKPMDKASEGILALKPVTFHYKKEIDSEGVTQLGLVAEEVEKVNPDLVVRDKDGKPYSVRYDEGNAMLLNEFLKEHKTTEKLEAAVASLIATVKEQAAQIQE
jgi:Chaperone of endosialidase